MAFGGTAYANLQTCAHKRKTTQAHIPINTSTHPTNHAGGAHKTPSTITTPIPNTTTPTLTPAATVTTYLGHCCLNRTHHRQHRGHELQPRAAVAHRAVLAHLRGFKELLVHHLGFYSSHLYRVQQHKQARKQTEKRMNNSIGTKEKRTSTIKINKKA
jgi:hypothetical protein